MLRICIVFNTNINTCLLSQTVPLIKKSELKLIENFLFFFNLIKFYLLISKDKFSQLKNLFIF